MRRAAAPVALVAAFAVMMFVGGCSRSGSDDVPVTGPVKVLVVGIDGLDWDRVNRLADEGRMPNVARLREEGASGVLHSIRPFVSPTIWTSIATGKVQEKHGIGSFTATRVAHGDSIPTTSNMRRVKAVWQLLSAAERTVGVIGWLVTYPADPVNGYLVSSHVTMALSDPRAGRAPDQTDEWLADGVYPPEIWSEVVDNVFTVDAAGDSAINYFVGTSAERALEEEKVRASSLVKFYAGDMTSLTLARHFTETMPADLTAVYFRGCDMASHFFWRYMEPETWKRKLSPEAVETFAPVVERYYALGDSLLGETMKLADDDTVVMLISDHGFSGHRGYRGFEGEVAVGIEMHREDGIVFIAGPGIERGRRIEGASVLDITPTVLALSGLPVARDMDGRPLTEALNSSFLDRNPIDYIETYEVEGDGDGDRAPVESPVDDEIKEMLRSLGYIN